MACKKHLTSRTTPNYSVHKKKRKIVKKFISEANIKWEEFGERIENKSQGKLYKFEI